MSAGYRDQVVAILERYDLGSPKIDERMMDWLRLFYMYSRLDLNSERDRLAAELETERMRLAACGVAALGYFDGCKDEYRSASLDDTLRLYEKTERLAAENAELVAQVQLAMPFVLADAKRTLNTYGYSDATYREAEQLATYARAALAKVKEAGK